MCVQYCIRVDFLVVPSRRAAHHVRTALLQRVKSRRGSVSAGTRSAAAAAVLTSSIYINLAHGVLCRSDIDREWDVRMTRLDGDVVYDLLAQLRGSVTRV